MVAFRNQFQIAVFYGIRMVDTAFIIEQPYERESFRRIEVEQIDFFKQAFVFRVLVVFVRGET